MTVFKKDNLKFLCLLTSLVILLSSCGNSKNETETKELTDNQTDTASEKSETGNAALSDLSGTTMKTAIVLPRETLTRVYDKPISFSYSVG